MKICEHVHAAINYTERLGAVLVNRANRVRAKVRSLRHGRNQREFLDKTWVLEIMPSELCVTKLRTENSTLKAELEECKAKCRNLEQRSSHLQAQVTMASTKLKQTAKHPSSSGSTSSPLQTRDVNREYSASHSRRLKRNRTMACELSLAWLEKEGYKVAKVEAVNSKTGEVEVICRPSRELMDALGQEPLSESDADTLQMILYVKDRFNISGQAYHEMTKICKSLPRSYKVKRLIAELNKQWKIFPTPEGTCGVQQSLKVSIPLCAFVH